MIRFGLQVLVASAALSLAACGGGGSDTSTTSSQADFPIEAAAVALHTVANTYSLSATDSNTGDVYVLSGSQAPSADATFEGALRKSIASTVVIRKNGALDSTGSTVSYFSVGPFKAYGSISLDGTYQVITSSPALPTTGRVGYAGTAVASTIYASSTKTFVNSTTTTVWTLEADTAITAWLCANTVIKTGTTSSIQATKSDCYKITTMGVIQARKVSVTINGTTLNFQ
jgi:hypothetical protein